MVGGVCAGLAAWSGIDPRVVRLAVVVAALLSGGAVVAGYVVAWVLIPPGAAEPRPAAAEQPAAGEPPVAAEHATAAEPGAGPAAAREQAVAEPLSGREDGYAVGDKLQTLVGGRRRASERDVPGAPPRSPSPFVAMDRVASGAGERLRSPQTREAVRRVAGQVSKAVSDGADEIARRTRRSG